MKKLFYVLLISIFCMGIVSCATTYTKIIKSKTTNTVFDEISEASGSNCGLSTGSFDISLNGTPVIQAELNPLRELWKNAIGRT